MDRLTHEWDIPGHSVCATVLVQLSERVNNNITITELINLTGFSRPTITRAISSLKEQQILDRSGAKKNGYWIVKSL